MPVIPQDQVRAALTQGIMGVVRDMPEVKSFMRSFFKMKTYATRYLSLEVVRGTERLSMDVLRGTEGTRNTFSKSTQNVFDPPYFREWFDITELDLYDRVIGSGSVDAGIFSQLLNDIREKYQIVKDKIDRAYEKQAADAMLLGVITLVSGESVNFHRLAGSLVANGAGNTWATGTVDPRTIMIQGCNFIRTEGKSQGGNFNIIMGATAYQDFINNTIIKASADIRRIDQIELAAPQRESTGATTFGWVAAGDYRLNIWSYPEYYEDANGVMQKYFDEKKIVILPDNPEFEHSFAAVPQLLDGRKSLNQQPYVYSEAIDEWNTVHKYDIRSAGLCILKKVNQVFTAQVVA